VATDTSEWIKQIFMLGTQGIGGGIIGIISTKLLVNLFGITTTYIIIFTLLLVSLIIYTKISLLAIFIKLKDNLILISSTIKNQILNFIFVPTNDKKIYKKFHPILDKAIQEFNTELKDRMKKRL